MRESRARLDDGHAILTDTGKMRWHRTLRCAVRIVIKTSIFREPQSNPSELLEAPDKFIIRR